jgi:hypothetical protein
MGGSLGFDRAEASGVSARFIEHNSKNSFDLYQRKRLNIDQRNLGEEFFVIYSRQPHLTLFTRKQNRIKVT